MGATEPGGLDVKVGVDVVDAPANHGACIQTGEEGVGIYFRA
jgi:hypothetical protein